MAMYIGMGGGQFLIEQSERPQRYIHSVCTAISECALRIDKGSPAGGVHSGTSIHNTCYKTSYFFSKQ